MIKNTIRSEYEKTIILTRAKVEKTEFDLCVSELTILFVKKLYDSEDITDFFTQYRNNELTDTYISYTSISKALMMYSGKRMIKNRVGGTSPKDHYDIEENQKRVMQSIRLNEIDEGAFYSFEEMKTLDPEFGKRFAKLSEQKKTFINR